MIVYNINKNISEVYLGDNSISEVYIGVNKVFPSETPPTPVFDGKYKFTVSGGTPIITASCNSSSVLTSGETRQKSYYRNYVEAVIGDCVTSIGDKAFQSFYSLSSITLSNSVTSIGSYGIYNCDSLITLRIPDSVTSIGAWGLADNTNLESITLPSGLTSISDYMMYGSTSLTSVTIPDNVTSIGGNAFGSCSGLTSVIVEAMTPPALGYGAFNNTNDCPIYVPSESVNAYKTAWSTYASRIQPIP